MNNVHSKYPQRKQNRLCDWDYSTPHSYYITICTKNNRNLFGEIHDTKMNLNDFGKIVEFSWHDLPNHNTNVNLDEFVIMPNHIHGIIILKYMQNAVGTDSKSVQNSKHNTKRTGLDPVPTKYHSLSEIIRQLKAFSTRRINKIDKIPGRKIWQRSYYDHIIRNENSLYNIRRYIQENPLRWNLDKINP